MTAIFGLCQAAILFSSCQESPTYHNNDDEPAPVTQLSGPTITLRLPGGEEEMSAQTADNIRLYMFKGGESNADRGRFDRRLLQVVREENVLTAGNVPVGTWDIALATTLDGVGIDRILSPVVGHERDEDVMLQLTPTAGVWPQAPELITGRVDGQQILANQTNVAPNTTLARNVAQVQVTVVASDEAAFEGLKGYSTEAGVHTMTLGNVPTTLNWEGKLLPLRDNPHTTGTGGLTGSFTITDESGGTQTCNTLTFLVPAHRGDDDNPADVTTSKLTVSVKLKYHTLSGDKYYEKGPVEIPVSLCANKRLLVKLIPTEARLEVQSSVADWDYKQNNIIFE
jgi:hypothetical protein